ncbi:MAG: adenosine deaminase [Clostridia bacterium]|nr:adenosine deaminase [Clostridia bacterium]
MNEVSAAFAEALKNDDLDALMEIPKAERHTHTGLTGNPKFVFKRTGVWIAPLQKPLASMEEMHRWVGRHIGERFGDTAGEKLLIEACFEQATRDGIRVLWTGEDVWANDALFGGDITALAGALQEAKRFYAPDIELHMQIGFSRHCPIDALQKWAEPFFVHGGFDCVDLYGDEGAQPIEAFVPLYRQAKALGMTLRAHVGEWGQAHDVQRAVEALELDEVQHGIAAAGDPSVMRFLADHRIRLNICPTSNLMLGRVASLQDHPIRKLYDAGVRISIGSDDALVFGSSLSQEYMKLYQNGLFTAQELDGIRIDAFC